MVWRPASELVAPLSTVPPIGQVFTTRNAEDLNLLNVGRFFALARGWLVSVLVNRAVPPVVPNTTWLACQAVLVAGALRSD